MKVSIITVCKNSAGTIEQAVQSVLNQSYDDIEYIIIDGQSTDGTCQIIEKYQHQLAFYSSELDDGIYYAMNKGIVRATGEIIGILNSDDWYAEDAVERVVEAFEKYDCEMVHGKMAMIYGEEQYKIIAERNLADLYIGMSIAHPTVFLKRDVYLKYGCFDEKYKSAADYELMLRLYLAGIRIKFIPHILTYFRSGGYSQQNERLSLNESIEIAKFYIEKATDIDKEKMLEKLQKNYEEKLWRSRVKCAASYLGDDKKHDFLQNQIAIWGTGLYGILCLDLLKCLSINFEVWIDSNVSKQGKTLLNKQIISLDAAISKSYMILIASKDYEQEMIEQLELQEVPKERYMTLSEFEKTLLERVGNI